MIVQLWNVCSILLRGMCVSSGLEIEIKAATRVTYIELRCLSIEVSRLRSNIACPEIAIKN